MLEISPQESALAWTLQRSGRSPAWPSERISPSTISHSLKFSPGIDCKLKRHLLQRGPALHGMWRRQRQELIESLQHPAPGSEPLAYSSKFARSIPAQFGIILCKFFTLYNRMPE